MDQMRVNRHASQYYISNVSSYPFYKIETDVEMIFQYSDHKNV